jgi:hypothetical protein
MRACEGNCQVAAVLREPAHSMLSSVLLLSCILQTVSAAIRGQRHSNCSCAEQHAANSLCYAWQAASATAVCANAAQIKVTNHLVTSLAHTCACSRASQKWCITHWENRVHWHHTNVHGARVALTAQLNNHMCMQQPTYTP